MIPKELQITVSRTVNLGNFESLRVEAGFTVSLEPGEDLDDVREKMLPVIKRTLQASYRTHVPQPPQAGRSER